MKIFVDTDKVAKIVKASEKVKRWDFLVSDLAKYFKKTGGIGCSYEGANCLQVGCECSDCKYENYVFDSKDFIKKCGKA